MPDRRFSKRCRLLTPPEFDRVFERRRGVTNGRMTVAGRENELGDNSLGSFCLASRRQCHRPQPLEAAAARGVSPFAREVAGRAGFGGRGQE